LYIDIFDTPVAYWIGAEGEEYPLETGTLKRRKNHE
jgi:hypothetical protein